MRSHNLLLLALSSGAAAIWPAPASLKNGTTTLWISRDIAVSYDITFSHSGTQDGDLADDNIVRDATSRVLDTIENKGLLPWRLRPRHSDFEPSISDQKFIKTLKISQRGEKSILIPSEADESYNLTVSESGEALISSSSTAGTLHGLQTFSQLFYRHSAGGSYTTLAPVAIVDAPKFKHRGVNLDISRSWYPVKDLLRTIDALSYNKMNTLHLHMSDSQSWPMEIPSIPELSEKGSYYKGLTYSPNDIDLIQRYALQRGVSVYIEFDMPGHTTAIGLSHPELIAAAEAKPWRSYCAEPPCGTLQLNNHKVYSFLNKLFADVLPRVQGYSPYFHTGGDEVNANAYSLDPTVKSSDHEVIRRYMQKFVDRNHAQVRRYHLAPIVWEEMLTDWNLTLGKDVVIQQWYTPINQIVAKGHKVIAADKTWYLDCGRGAWLNYANGAPFKNAYPFNDYCSPFKNWRLVYAFDPLANVPKDKQHLVLGGEVHHWSEHADAVGLDAVLWPRASAAGEVLWSGRQDANGEDRSQMDAAPRLSEMRERLALLGLDLDSVHMPFCTQHDPTECS